MTNPLQRQIIHQILEERKRQDEKWGVQTHAPADWLTILGEEVGEVNKAAYEAKHHTGKIKDYREELIQVAAVAVAMIECFDRIEDKVMEKRSALRMDLVQNKIDGDFYQNLLGKLHLKDFILNPNLLNDGLGK